MNLLLADGHAFAPHWPIARVWSESSLSAERENRRMATEATLLHSAAAAVMGGKKGAKQFEKTLKELTG